MPNYKPELHPENLVRTGRPKGAKTKFSHQAKENVVAVFTRLGGTAAMARWAMKSKTEFYKLYARLLPTDVTATITIHDASELSDAELYAIATGGGEGVAVETAGEDVASQVH